jgi:hypothetical protein
LRGRYEKPSFRVGNTPLPVSFNDGPALAEGLPYFMSLTAAGKYRYGFSLPGWTGNWLYDLALANDGAAWYAGNQQGALAVGSLYAPAPGPSENGALLFRASPSGAIDELHSYSGGFFLAVDVDGRGNPVVGGSFPGGVDFGAGMTSPGKAVVARLNLAPGTTASADGSSGGSGGAGSVDASVGSSGIDGGTGDGAARDAAAADPVEFAVTFGDANNVDIAADRMSGATYVSLDGTLVKLRPDGTIAWQKGFPGAGSWSMPLVVDADGNVIVASGYSDGTVLGLAPDAGAASGPGLFVAKYTPDGATVFAKTWPGGPPNLGSSAVTPDGRILVGGYLYASSINFGDGAIGGQGAGFVVSIGPTGTYEWSRGSDNSSVKSLVSDPKGNAIVIGYGQGSVNFGGLTHTNGNTNGNQSDYLIARFSPSGDETDFHFYGDPNISETEISGAADRAGNLYLAGEYSGLPVGNPPVPFGFNDAPALAIGLPYFISLAPSGNYRYGSSLPGYFLNGLANLAVANDGAAWYAGLQRGALALGGLLTPDPGNGGEGEGGLLFRTSPTGTVDQLRCYPGGYFLAVDADGQGRPIVGGKFRGGVDFGAGMIPMGNPSTVVAKLNLR